MVPNSAMNMEDASEKRGFYSAVELAALKLPGFPTTDRAARTRAEAEGWEFVLVKSRGAKGSTKRYRPPAEIQALIDRGEPAGCTVPAALQSQSQSQVDPATRAYGVAEPGPSDVNSEINAHLLWLCHDACLQVHGEAFTRENIQVQIDYAVDLYNLLLRLSAAKRANARSNPKDFNRLDAEDMGSQLRLLLQMGWVKPFPPPKFDPKRVTF